MRVAIIGSSGWVGKEMVKLFSSHNPVLYDEPLKIGNRNDANKANVAFVCVPTPMKEDGACDTSIVENVLEWLQTPLIILRSTVPPGTCDSLSKKYKKGIVMNPEYVGETVDHPLMNSASRKFLILGGEKQNTQRAIEVYQLVYNASVQTYQCSAIEAELIKYCENSFIGTYVTFCNEFYNICQTHGVDWNIVREGFLMDPRMTRYWTFVYPEKRGFSGKCIPKDMNAIVQASSSKGYTPEFLASVIANNTRMQKPPKIDLNPRYLQHEEVRVNTSPYAEYYLCLEKTFDLIGKSFCDVGCANGPLLNEIHTRFPSSELFGIEYFQYQKDNAPSTVKDKMIIADLRDDLKLDRKYDIVNCTEVAEHIDPGYCEQFLQNLDKLVGKYLIMTWSKHKDDPNKAVETHQHFNPQPPEAYRAIMSKRGYRENRELTERFLSESWKYQNFSFWWRESLVIWERI